MSFASVVQPRRGVSVLEVLIAIGVASVGLLGAILLIPLADHQLNRGLVLEKANQLGGNAFREIDVRRINNPSNWMWGLRGSVQYVARPRDLFYPFDPVLADPLPLPQCREAFCIDPRFLASNGITATATGNPNLFPYVDPLNTGLLRMPRITLAAIPGGANAMGSQQADSIFVSLDDLEFRRPTNDRLLPPVQLDNSGGDWQDPTNATPGTDQRTRKAFGRMSWMATLVPREEFGGGGDTYTLSVVVFHQRDASFSMDPPADEAGNERVVQIPLTTSPACNGFLAGGVGGGDVALMPRVSGLIEDDAARELSVKTGDWVMLSRANRFQSGVDALGNAIFTEGPRWHRWYRVLAADPLLYDSDNVTSNPSNPPSDSWIRYVTLDGPDWPAASPNQIPATATSFPTQVTIVKDVVAVFEKTIRLETSSLWTN